MSFLSKRILSVESLELIDASWLDKFFELSRTESTYLEFKSGRLAKDKKIPNKIVNTICAFLNSGGGILVWGAPEEHRENDRKVFCSSCSPVQTSFEHDSFISSISDRINPLPNEITFHKVPYSEGFVYIIEIEKSDYSPHQVSDDSLFYFRLDGQTRIAPYHYIEALFKKINYPNIEGTISSPTPQITNEKITLNFSTIFVNKSGLLNDEKLTYSLQISQGEFDNWGSTFRDLNTQYSQKGKLKRHVFTDRTLHYGDPITHQQSVLINFPTVDRSLELELVLEFGAQKSPLKISTYKWTIYRKAGIYEVRQNSVQVNKLASQVKSIDSINRKINRTKF